MNNATKSIIASVYDPEAVRQYLVHEEIDGEIVATIGCISIYPDGSAML